MDVAAVQAITGAAPASGTTKKDDPARAADAARQFEALLMAQLLRSAREGEGGWGGDGQDSSAGCATDYAEQAMATAMASRGGLGLSSLILTGLRKDG
jgi:peptidoglycan hydrolase FlgJ